MKAPEIRYHRALPVIAALALACSRTATVEGGRAGEPQRLPAEAAPEPVRKGASDGSLGVRIVSKKQILYAAGGDAGLERPAHVRAASGVASFAGKLAVVQDDAQFIALVDPRTGLADGVVLPPGMNGRRVFDDRHGNKELKFDFESLTAVKTEGGPLLVGLGSGSTPSRDTVLLVRRAAGDVDAQIFPAARFYSALREFEAFSGSELNVEGLTDLGDGRLRLFQRGNGMAKNGVDPADASVDVSLAELIAFLDAPATAPVPRLSNPVRYQLGALDGVRLTFSDAARRGDSVLFLAGAEASADATHDGAVVGSVLGVIDPAGEVRWAQLMDAARRPVRDKPEGLCVDPHDANRLWLVTDADDPDRPSELLEAVLSGSWDREN